MKDLRVAEGELRKLLVDELGILSVAEFESTQATAKRLRTSIVRILLDRGIPQSFLMEQLAQAWGIPYIDLKVSDIKPKAFRLVNEAFARTHTLIPFDLENGQVKLAMADPRDQIVLEEVRRKTRLTPVPYLASVPSILRAHLLYKGDLREMLKQASGEVMMVARPKESDAQNTQASELLERVLEYAALNKASDIHIEPYETEILVRCRIDGVLQEVLSLSPEVLPSLTSRIKVVAKMRIDERRVPQDGRFEVDLGGLKFDLRVSSLPTQWGEKIVIRVLSKEVTSFDLERLGLMPSDYDIVQRNILRPYGMVLVTGPTGTGKSTTLYAILTRLGAERKYVINISTVEDPTEYLLPRVSQVSINSSAGLTFPVALRSLLRQDPDVIMVGEIRDQETADIAVRAAMVGRLLFSTLHTNDATGAILRMIDIGVDPFMLASTITMVLGQRLVRRICPNCKESIPVSSSILAALRSRPDFENTIRTLQSQNVLGKGDNPLAGIRYFRGKGCVQCQGSGFRGRLGVFEVFEITDAIRTMIIERTGSTEIRAAAMGAGMKTLFQDGLAKVFLGETSFEEVTRVAL